MIDCLQIESLKHQSNSTFLVYARMFELPCSTLDIKVVVQRGNLSEQRPHSMALRTRSINRAIHQQQILILRIALAPSQLPKSGVSVLIEELATKPLSIDP